MTDVFAVRQAPVQLKPQLDRDGNLDSSMALGWCINRDIIEDLKRQAINPQLLLVITHNNQEVSRELVPLFPALHFVGFHHVGANQVHAAIVWSSDGDPESLEALFFTKDNKGKWRCPVLNYRGTEIRMSFDGDCERYYGNSRVTVDVDPKLLSQIRFKRTHNYINYMFKSPPHDPCHTRKRAFVILPLTAIFGPIAVVLCAAGFAVIMLFKLVFAAGATLLGLRDINYKVLIEPKTDPKYIWLKCQSSIWTHDSEGHRHPVFFWLFNPPVMLATYLIFLGGLEWSLRLAWAVLAPAIIGVVLTVGRIIFKRQLNARLARKEREKQALLSTEAAEWKDVLESLVCNGKGVPSTKNLPHGRQYWRLRAQAKTRKAKELVACRPYAAK